MLMDSSVHVTHTPCDCATRIAEITRQHLAEHAAAELFAGVQVSVLSGLAERKAEPESDWLTDQTPLPDDVMAYRGPGHGAVLHLARFMRWWSPDPVGISRVQARKAIRAHVPILYPESIDRAWNALRELGRLDVVSGSHAHGPSVWVVRTGDPA